jgi:hypothetical protein
MYVILMEFSNYLFRKKSNILISHKTNLGRMRASLNKKLIHEFGHISDTLFCRLCKRKILVRDAQQASLNHVHTHLDANVYRCLICSKQSKNYSSMLSHISKDHKATAKGNYEENLDEHHDEIMDMLKKCYDLNYVL